MREGKHKNGGGSINIGRRERAYDRSRNCFHRVHYASPSLGMSGNARPTTGHAPLWLLTKERDPKVTRRLNRDVRAADIDRPSRIGPGKRYAIRQSDRPNLLSRGRGRRRSLGLFASLPGDAIPTPG